MGMLKSSQIFCLRSRTSFGKDTHLIVFVSTCLELIQLKCSTASKEQFSCFPPSTLIHLSLRSSVCFTSIFFCWWQGNPGVYRDVMLLIGSMTNPLDVFHTYEKTRTSMKLTSTSACLKLITCCLGFYSSSVAIRYTSVIVNSNYSELFSIVTVILPWKFYRSAYLFSGNLIAHSDNRMSDFSCQWLLRHSQEPVQISRKLPWNQCMVPSNESYCGLKKIYEYSGFYVAHTNQVSYWWKQ